MTNYELMVILDSTLDEEKTNAALEKIKTFISEAGELGDVDVWGSRDLAYPINKQTKGYYAVIEFKAEPDVPKELNRRLRISDDVIRHIIVNKDAK